MIAFIKGQISDIDTDKLVIENQGMGYNVFVTSRVLSGVSTPGGTIKLYTYFSVKEDSMSLFGFPSKDELDLFRKLINVNGIGPKGALSLLSFMTIDELRLAILSEDSKAISKAPGIGAKTASRIIIDLKDKIDIENIFGNPAKEPDGNNVEGDESIRNDAVEALVALGYSPSQALGVVRSLPVSEHDNVENIIKNALKKMI
ncbi:MAG: Holliday junction branch migration protein RuvA [Lachnospiraceae bacterium]|nr:Holliday junction branch migration protein RuvA [Lachnospiraceae bacterium]